MGRKHAYWIGVGDDVEAFEKRLNKRGKEGWRAVGFAVHPQGGFSQPQTIVLMEYSLE